MKILLVEDEHSIAEPLRTFLEREDFEVVWKDSFAHAQQAIKQKFDAIILDWRLPDGEGIRLIPEIKNSDPLTPIVMLTAKADLVDKVVGLELGAVDYLTKPFAPRELLIRLKNHIENSRKFSANIASAAKETGEFKIQNNLRRITFRDQLLDLSKLEYKLLKFFIENPHQVFSRDELLDQVWGLENYPTTRTVDNHVMQLRHKTDESLFQTVRGAGYMYSEELTKR